ncbi:hypothetical protein GCM10025865_24340 [Paraoerskovia sediminicola]|uniref:DUF5808 domain-containing protein n=1 Tax=Paraoerskovia sediminicola TaxID=1138587 RepID=A0ABN6XEK9_9CELL|nr:DUF5808 domain-containing protein [Paraoerskovia sediminicola]BDZ43135.1 hypothetical protein GCM10025865_24340 [Paraoerskovia sediminicola]
MARENKHGGPSVLRLVVIGLTVAAVVKEIKKPESERTWNGTVAGFVPYDFRFPTVERFKERVWDPEGEHIVSPHVFGVGWTLNVGRVVALAKDGYQAVADV